MQVVFGLERLRKKMGCDTEKEVKALHRVGAPIVAIGRGPGRRWCADLEAVAEWMRVHGPRASRRAVVAGGRS